jgi:dipeptidase E
MVKEMNKKKMFLCSFFEKVASLLPKFAGEDLRGKTVAFIPTAGKHEEVNFFIATARQAFENLGMKINDMDISSISTKEIAEQLDQSDYIYVSGGNTFFLLQELKRTGADKLIKDQILKGKPYIGESAGSILVAPDISYMKCVNYSKEKAPLLKSFSALGVVDFYSVPHYKEEPFVEINDEVVRRYDKLLNLLPISNTQAVIVNGDTREIVEADK